MSMQRSGLTRERIRPLSKLEIDRRIEDLVADLASGEPASSTEPSDGGSLRPRWIVPSEIVRRVRPFLGRN